MIKSEELISSRLILQREGSGVDVVKRASAALGSVDVLVVCASVQSRTPFFQVTSDEIRRQAAINFRATVKLPKAVLPPMQQRHWGRVLMIGSINQLRPAPDLAIYAALKSAQHNLCVNLARQNARYNVMINSLSPGLVATERNRWRREDADNWRKIEASAYRRVRRARGAADGSMYRQLAAGLHPTARCSRRVSS